MKNFFLGFDTSNYKTSVALTCDDGSVLLNEQKYLTVKKGERGLRQSDALFQHVSNLPELTEKLREACKGGRIAAVSVSTRPRPVEGSYMPVFLAGYAAAKEAASLLDVPLYEFSHQEGHIAAVREGTPLEKEERFVSFHFSGGTTEAVLVDGETYTIVGGSRDIAFGQLLDRVGVKLGMQFPCGAEMDKIACGAQFIPGTLKLPPIRAKEGWIHLSGLETHCQRICDTTETKVLISALFREITQAIREMTLQIAKQYDVQHVLFAGGVSASQYVRHNLSVPFDYYFGDPALSTDNAVGIAYLGGKRYGAQTDHRITTE